MTLDDYLRHISAGSKNLLPDARRALWQERQRLDEIEAELDALDGRDPAWLRKVDAINRMYTDGPCLALRWRGPSSGVSRSSARPAGSARASRAPTPSPGSRRSAGRRSATAARRRSSSPGTRRAARSAPRPGSGRAGPRRAGTAAAADRSRSRGCRTARRRARRRADPSPARRRRSAGEQPYLSSSQPAASSASRRLSNVSRLEVDPAVADLGGQREAGAGAEVVLDGDDQRAGRVVILLARLPRLEVDERLATLAAPVRRGPATCSTAARRTRRPDPAPPDPMLRLAIADANASARSRSIRSSVYGHACRHTAGSVTSQSGGARPFDPQQPAGLGRAGRARPPGGRASARWPSRWRSTPSTAAGCGAASTSASTSRRPPPAFTPHASSTNTMLTRLAVGARRRSAARSGSRRAGS